VAELSSHVDHFLFTQLHSQEVAERMKMVTAIIQPSRLEVVKNILGTEGITGITVSDARGVGRQRGRTEIYRGHEYKVDLIPKVKLEIAVEQAHVDRVIDAIVKGARSGPEGKIGDGKIFVSPLEEVVRIRTGELGAAAL
jgi:nitrogen regulatory protein PII